MVDIKTSGLNSNKEINGLIGINIILKNGKNSKIHVRKEYFLLIISIFVFFVNYCSGQTTVVQQQQQVVVNPVVIEKPVYIEKYRTVYVDKPKRVARKLDKPVLLLGYLWVHTEDLGNFKQQQLDGLTVLTLKNLMVGIIGEYQHQTNLQ